MSAQTEVLPDSLESLNFEPQCTDGSGPRTARPRCERPAEYALRVRTCPGSDCTRPAIGLVCAHHLQAAHSQIARNVIVSCSYCNEVVARAKDYYLSWTRL